MVSNQYNCNGYHQVQFTVFYIPVVYIKTNIPRLGKEGWGNVDKVQNNQKEQTPPKYISLPRFSTGSLTKLKYTVLQ